MKSLLTVLFVTTFALKPIHTEDVWKTLLEVKYRLYKGSYIPQFDDKIEKLEGKKIQITGYMYPLQESLKHEFFMLSYYPIKICFFCGGAGPESVVEVSADTPIRFSNKKITLEGTLRLNKDDPERLFFFLSDAKQIK